MTVAHTFCAACSSAICAGGLGVVCPHKSASGGYAPPTPRAAVIPAHLPGQSFPQIRIPHMQPMHASAALCHTIRPTERVSPHQTRPVLELPPLPTAQASGSPVSSRTLTCLLRPRRNPALFSCSSRAGPSLQVVDALIRVTGCVLGLVRPEKQVVDPPCWNGKCVEWHA